MSSEICKISFNIDISKINKISEMRKRCVASEISKLSNTNGIRNIR